MKKRVEKHSRTYANTRALIGDDKQSDYTKRAGSLFVGTARPLAALRRDKDKPNPRIKTF